MSLAPLPLPAGIRSRYVSGVNGPPLPGLEAGGGAGGRGPDATRPAGNRFSLA